MNVDNIKQQILECNSYDQINELYNFMTSYPVREIMHKLYREKYTKQREKNREATAKIKAREEEEYPAILAFVKNVVKPGDLLKFKGASRSGIRQVITIDSRDILGHVVQNMKRIEGVLKVSTTGYTSSNGIDKLIGYYSETDRCFLSRKTIVEQGTKFLSNE